MLQRNCQKWEESERVFIYFGTFSCLWSLNLAQYAEWLTRRLFKVYTKYSCSDHLDDVTGQFM